MSDKFVDKQAYTTWYSKGYRDATSGRRDLREAVAGEREVVRIAYRKGYAAALCKRAVK